MLNFSASFFILPCASCTISVSHLSSLRLALRVGRLFVKAGLCRRWGIDQPGGAMAYSFVSSEQLPLFISLMSLAGYMLLIKHAARLLIVNLIQFVPRTCREWASPPITKVSEQPCQSCTKEPRHHFYLTQAELLPLSGSHRMRCYPDSFPGRHSSNIQSKHSWHCLASPPLF